MAAVTAHQPEWSHRHRLSIPILQTPNAKRRSGIFSPVNELGSFEFDRVIKSGSLMKRRKRTNAWDTVRLVLRPNQLSIYRDEQETRLKHQITLSDITAVALRKDRKRKGDHDGFFGIFSPSRNFHLEADTENEAQEWVDMLRREAGIDREAAMSTTGSYAASHSRSAGLARSSISAGRSSMASTGGPSGSTDALETTRFSSSLPRLSELDRFPPQRPLESSNLSSSEKGSISDMSEVATFGSLRNMSLNSRFASPLQSESPHSATPQHLATPTAGDDEDRNFYAANFGGEDERVLWHGYLQCLKNNTGVRQWKRYWVVLRTRHLALYKSDEEYAAILILPLASMIDAVETDPVSKGKDSCMQIITDERSYRFCCADEEDLSRWLGALKSTLALRKKKEAGARSR